MASDAPYGTPAFAATMWFRHGMQVGLSPDALRGVLGGQARRLAERGSRSIWPSARRGLDPRDR